MKNALCKFDENLDNQISQVELYKFFDRNIKDGKYLIELQKVRCLQFLIMIKMELLVLMNL